MPFVDVRITKRSAHANLELRVIHEPNVSVNLVSATVLTIVVIEPFVRPMSVDSNVIMMPNVSIMRNVSKVFVPVLVKPTNLVLLVSFVNLVNVRLAVGPITNVQQPLHVLIVNVSILVLPEQPVVLMPFVELIITRKAALVNQEPKVTRESDVPDNRCTARTLMPVEIEPFVRPTFVDSSVIMKTIVSITKNVQMVFVLLHVKLMNLVPVVSFVTQVNVKLVVDRIKNVHLLPLV